MDPQLLFAVRATEKGWSCDEVSFPQKGTAPWRRNDWHAHVKILHLAAIFAVLKLRWDPQHPRFCEATNCAGEAKLNTVFKNWWDGVGKGQPVKWLNAIFEPLGGMKGVLDRRGRAENGCIRFAQGFSGDDVAFDIDGNPAVADALWTFLIDAFSIVAPSQATVTHRQPSCRSLTDEQLAEVGGPQNSPPRSAVQGPVLPLPDIFVGREAALAELKSRLLSSVRTAGQGLQQRLIVIRGLPGIGKSTVAAALCHDADIKRQFSDGDPLCACLGQNIKEPELIAQLAVWGRALGIGDLLRCNPEEAKARLVGALRDRRILLVVDDVWDARHLKPFKVGGVDCALCVTTRETRVAHDIAPKEGDIYVLPILSDNDAIDLLERIVPSVVKAYRNACEELARELEGLPLGLRVAGGLLKVEASHGTQLVAQLLNDLRVGKKLLEAQAPSDRADLANQTIPTVAVLLKKSTDRLDRETRTCFAYLGGFRPKPATFDLRAMRSIWGVNDPKPTADNLVDRGLLEYVKQTDRYYLHSLLKLHAFSLCSASEARIGKARGAVSGVD